MTPLNIVYLTTEAVPFAKSGGLADVCGALPTRITALGHHAALIMPAFRSVHEAGLPIQATDISFAIPMSAGKLVGCRLLSSRLPESDVQVWLIDQPQYFHRPGLYGTSQGDYPDNAERFAFFCRAAIQAIPRIGWSFDIVHCNDWQTGLIPRLLQLAAPVGVPATRRDRGGASGEIAAASAAGQPSRQPPPSQPPPSRPPATVLTIHNLAYQGSFPADQFAWTGLDWSHFNLHEFEFYGRLNFLKAGIVAADSITTVSPRYAREIRSPERGCGLQQVLDSRADRLTGIINGIDRVAWDPATDQHLTAGYERSSWRQGKRANKQSLQQEFALEPNSDVPLIGLVGRLAEQKGWDLILPVLERHLVQQRPTQWFVLGSGDRWIEDRLRELHQQYPQQLALHIGFSDPLAHRIEAAADVFVMPSHYEPCGLNQLYSLRYGAVPVVTPTGGLADTVTDCNQATLADRTATGFILARTDADGLDDAIGRALNLRYHHPDAWAQLVETGMAQDWSWRSSAAEYLKLYRQTIDLKSNTT